MTTTRTIPNALLIPEIDALLREGHSVKFRVRGYSMRPFLEDRRDLVSLCAPNGDIQLYDVVLAKIAPDTYVLHRVIAIQGDHLTLRGDGNVVGVEHCDKADVLGVATAFWRKGRNNPDLITARKWKTYSKIWLALTPLRRWVLAYHRRIVLPVIK